MLPLRNAAGFFISNHNADASKGQLKWKLADEWKSDNELDRWLIAVLQDLSKKVEAEMSPATTASFRKSPPSLTLRG
ncbi:MAG: hypothetical protein LBB36_03520 [Fibromonadaceae bacterium]|nr:hypothetical protein [Fibromonadaceae bacterium]